MYRQTVDVVKNDAISDGGATETYELESSGFLSYLDLYFPWSKDDSAADNIKGGIADYLTAIEVIGDSTDVIFSLDGRELAALDFYMLGMPVTELRNEDAASDNVLHMPLPFGRKLWDPEYALDLSKWDLVECNITYSDPEATTGFDASESYITIREKFLRDYGGPVGYLKSYEMNDWNPSANVSEKKLTFPKNHPIRMVMISIELDAVARTAAFAYEMGQNVTNVKLTGNSGNLVFFDEELLELMRQNEDEFGLVQMGGVVQGDDADYFSTDLGYTLDGNISIDDIAGGTTASMAVALSNFPENRLLIDESNLAAAANLNWQARGYAYMTSAIFHFDQDLSMENLLDPEALKDAQILYTTTQDDCKVRTCIQQVKT